MINFFQRLEEKILSRYSGWLDKRIPPKTEVTLLQKNIFIYPIWQFIYYFIVIMAIWLAATNYENNLAFALAFLMLSIFVVCIFHTYRNLAGLTVSVIRATPVFYGEYAEVELLLVTQENKWRNAISLSWERGHGVIDNLIERTEIKIKVPVKTNQRGWFNPKRLTVESIYPLGIIRSVSYLDLAIKILVYPKPICLSELSTQSEGEESGQNLSQQGSGTQEFSQLKDYEPGVSLKQVAWKQYAKGRGLLIKEHSDYMSDDIYLNWEAFSHLGVEERLSTLCYWALALDKKSQPYGLALPGKEILPDQGAPHLRAVLTALALYGVDKL